MSGTSSNSDIIRIYEDKQLAEEYIKYRPGYPPFILKTILQYMEETNAENLNTFDTMIDVDCGSGQATHMFAEHFRSVLGIDISESQIEIAYNSLDLVSCATAAHWLNLPTFERECNRVLKTNGCVAIYTYLLLNIKSSDDNHGNLQSKFFEIVTKFVNDCEGHEKSKLKGYQEIFNEINNTSKKWVSCPDMDKAYNLPSFKKFMATLGEYSTYMKSNPSVDPLEQFGDSIKKLVCKDELMDNDVDFKITFGYQMILFRK
uniref:putative methyltransferase DDB_G0268948 n=1 Tax=Styela clava TaxID=7725 RepID=UPI00193AC4F2|nr:putative methyltransferase DDB_G0268948 [Styela clava]